MTKSEYLESLKEFLQSELSSFEVDKNMQFYNEYIDSETKSGILEEEVLKKLGDPRLIAKTIIETYNMSKDINSDKNRNNYNKQQYDYYNEQTEYSTTNNKNNHTKFVISSNSSLLQKIISIVSLIVIIVFVLIIGGLAIRIFFKIILPVLLIYLVFKIIFRK